MTVVQHKNTICFICQLYIVRHHDQTGLPRANALKKQIKDDVGGMPIEIPGRFVGQQTGRVTYHRPGNGGTLALATGKLTGAMFETMAAFNLTSSQAGV